MFLSLSVNTYLYETWPSFLSYLATISSANQYGVSFIEQFVFCIVASDWFISFIVHQSFSPTSSTVRGGVRGVGKLEDGVPHVIFTL